jgi:hypothetical protein
MNRDIIAIGGSAGGVEVLLDLVRDLCEESYQSLSGFDERPDARRRASSRCNRRE